MRRVASPIAAFGLAFSVILGTGTLACGSRSELLSILGDHLDDGDGGINGHRRDGGLNDGSDDGASKDGALEASSNADVDAAPPNPCGGYQAYSPWPAFQRCSAHIGRTDAIGPTKPVVAWSSQIGETLPLQPGVVGPPTIAADGTIYVANERGQLVAFAPGGSTSWVAQLTFLESGPSAVAIGNNGTLYVELDQLYAVSPAGGNIWTAKVYPGVGSATIGPAPSSVTVSQDGTLYVGTSTGLISVTSGGSFTQVNTQEEQGWTAAIDLSDVVYSADAVGVLSATSPSGAPLWTYSLQGAGNAWIQTSPVIAEDGTIYFGALDSFYAFSSKGDVKWQLPWQSKPPPQTSDTMAIGADGTVYLATPDSTLTAISTNGKTLWSLPIFLAGSPPVIDGNGTIYILGGPNNSGDDGILLAVSPKGEVLWQIALTGSRGGALAVGADGTIYASTYPGGVLFAIGQAP